ncbi:hypothetical protein BDN71DRAFT_1457856 [Pleurotus eryngii]|uniref:Uncharacterized protein n=1 Tax=Pleurotus eryngii TaxID=5323 RepID=A0A9P5ZGU6_PLEER|nr:hypothetical protein BDN71DRAFT_1457856 [Pleurotus eryngii]
MEASCVQHHNFRDGNDSIATTIRFAQQAGIFERGYDGGPYAFLLHEEQRPIVLLGLYAASIADFLIDEVLVHRIPFHVGLLWLTSSGE